MNCAVICWRPYQVFNAINLLLNDVENSKGNSDLFIQDIPIMHNIASEIGKIGCFRNIYTFTENNRGDGVGITHLKMARIYAMRTRDFIAPKHAIKRNCSQIKEFVGVYDVIMCSGWISFSMEFVNCNPKAKLVLFEDGSGNYVNDLIENMPCIQKIYYSLLKAIFKKGPLVAKVNSMYVYEPSAMTVKRKYPVYGMPKINDDVYMVLCNVFGYKKEDDIYMEESIVFLDQPMKHIGKNYDQQQVISYLSSDPKFVCRRHPIQKNNEALKYEDKKRPMWELVVNKFTHNTVLVSIFSTGQLTPSMIYGLYPTLVFLYRMNEEEGSDAYLRINRFINQFRNNYRGKIFEPRTFSEFVDVMDKIKTGIMK